jgi:LCP family protein required for cell wall assembly
VQRPAPPPPPRPPSKPGRKRRWIRLFVVAVLVVVLVAALVIVGVGVWVDRSLHRQAVLADYPGRPTAGHGTTWLFVGSDSRNDLTPQQESEYSTGDENRSGLTDTIMLIHVPSLWSSTSPTVVSIPRDATAQIPDYGTGKINSAFSLGGGSLLVRTVEQTTHLHVDHYAEIGFLGVADVVDAVGGVPICLPEAVHEEEYAHVDLDAGCQTLDGRDALGYVRTRYAFPDADLRRVKNQREFLTALLHRAASPAVWLNPLRWFSMPRAVIGALTVDEGAHVWDLARLGWALNGSPVMLTVPNNSGDVEWSSDDVSRLFTALENDDAIPAELLDQAGG